MHVNSPEFVVPFVEMLAATVGRVLFTVTEEVDVTALPWSSVAVRMQKTTSPGEELDGLKTKVASVVA